MHEIANVGSLRVIFTDKSQNLQKIELLFKLLNIFWGKVAVRIKIQVSSPKGLGDYKKGRWVERVR